jgi:mannose-6-phosphate isomerase-like protein (cupin superfamily)
MASVQLDSSSMVIASSVFMLKTSGYAGAIVVAAVLNPVLAQKPVPDRRPVPAMSLQIVVNDHSGTGLEGVDIGVSGTESRRASTDARGLATIPILPGTYRLRFERERFITLERDVTIGRSQPATVMVALGAALPPPPPPAPPPPAPAPPEAVALAASPAAAAGGPPIHVSLPEFLDQNFIGRDPLKESVLGCTAGATTRVLQLRDALALHTHSDLDEILYVVAGDGVVRVRDETMMLTPGSLTVIPRGLPHATERRGRNPLIVLSTLAGAACPAAPRAESSGSRR